MDADEKMFIDEFEAAMADTSTADTASIALGVRIANGLLQYEQTYGCETEIADLSEPYRLEDGRTIGLEVQTTNGDSFLLTFDPDEARSYGLAAPVTD
jgi:hypothetical protein